MGAAGTFSKRGQGQSPGNRAWPLSGARWVAAIFPGRAWIAVELFAHAGDRARLAHCAALARQTGLPQVAAGDVHMHVRARRALQDTVTAIRVKKPLAECGYALHPNGERHLRSRARLAAIYPPELLAETVAIAQRCAFSLDQLRYEYPEEIVPEGQTPASHLRALVEAGLARRYRGQTTFSAELTVALGGGVVENVVCPRVPGSVPFDVRELVEHELALIAELKYEPYFLTVHDIVAFARAQGILCQGRGSAANSAVCYALGITEVDPARMSMLFERFISKERNEPPDIDVDFEHQRREEVIQYIYAKYGRDRAALAATLITYRPKSAVRDVGRALGLDLAQIDRLAGMFAWWDGREVKPDRVREAGFEPDNPVFVRLVTLTGELMGFPRHLSQHVGGFVIAREALERMVPIENAAMAERTVLQWDKDDLDALGLLKVDCLALGMLSAIRRCLDLVSRQRGRELRMQDIPGRRPGGLRDVPARRHRRRVPDRIARADGDAAAAEAGELLRSRDRGRHRASRPDPGRDGAPVPAPPAGPGARHLSERRRAERARAHARRADLPGAGDAARDRRGGFTPGEADQLRRSMAAWRRKGGLEQFEHRLIDGMGARGFAAKFAGRSSSRSWVSASTAFRNRTRRPSPCSSTCRRG